jgi:hypothetical protein
MTIAQVQISIPIFETSGFKVQIQTIQSTQIFWTSSLDISKPHFKGAFTPNVKSMLSENLGGVLGGTQT